MIKDKIMLAALMAVFCINVFAQKELPFGINETITHEALDVQNQNRTSTCWSFSALSFWESEIKRMGKKPVNLSEMFVVRMAYMMKAEQYIRMHGTVNFGPGGAFHDVTNVIAKYGIVPESAYPGLEYGKEMHHHGELDAVLKGFLDALLKNKGGSLSPAWKDAYAGILDAYLGKVPETFEFGGKSYDAKKFADYLGLDPKDYVELSSFTHHDFYEDFVLEVPDNWAWDRVYNLPLDEFTDIAVSAIKDGFTLAWASDVSHIGFKYKAGIAIIPENDSDLSSIENLATIEEKNITQKMRQVAFNDYSTQDDHGMHIIGLAKDEAGDRFFTVKNSWGKNNVCDGYFYASIPYFQLQTTDIMVHKDALPKSIRNKLGL